MIKSIRSIYNKAGGKAIERTTRAGLVLVSINNSRNIKSQNPASISSIANVHVENHAMVLTYAYRDRRDQGLT